MVQICNSYQIDDETSSSSNSRTPSPIPAKRPISATQADSDTVTEPLKLHEKSNQSPNEMSGSQLKRLRRTRGDSGSVCYNMKYHPLDEFLRPNASTTVQARSQRLIYSSHQGGLLPADNSKHEIGSIPHSGRILKNDHSSRNRPAFHQSSSLPTDKSKQEINFVSHSKKISKRSQVSRERPLPTRSSARLGARAGELIKKRAYDMGHHPMDDVLKTKIRKRGAMKRSLVKGSSIQTSSERSSMWLDAVLLPCTSSPAPPLEMRSVNPFTKPIPADWVNLEYFDRRVYLLQQGAPLHGETLSMPWLKVVENLVREGFFSKENFEAFGGMKALKSRYETVRLGVERFFGAKPEQTDKRDWPIMYMEDMKVFELDTKTKYWSHPRHKLVNPISTKFLQRVASNSSVEENADDSYAHSPGPNVEAHKSTLRRKSDDYSSDNSVPPDDQMNSFGEAFDLISPGSGQSDAIDSVDTIPHDQVSTPLKKPSTGFQIREDEAGRTPKIRTYIAMNPTSPGTDIQKENFENLDSSGEHEARNHYRLSPSEQRFVSIPPSSHSVRFQAVSALQRS